MQFPRFRKNTVSFGKKRSRVAYTRNGVDKYDVLGDGGTGAMRKYKTKWVTARNGNKYEIPIDKNGKVPKEFLYAWFLNPTVGTRNGHWRNPVIDIGIDADVIHEIPRGGFTPEQLVETGWIQHPNESDIVGIDDMGA